MQPPISGDNHLEAGPEASAGLGDDALLHVGEFLCDGGPEGVKSVVGVFIALSLENAPEKIVEGIAVRGARGPKVCPPVCLYVSKTSTFLITYDTLGFQKML